MISHYNIIPNGLQYSTQESVGRKEGGIDTVNIAGILSFSHGLELVLIAH